MKSYHDITGDGGSRVLEQVQAQRKQIEQRLAGVQHLVAVGSGKGGVGKSTMTMQLAACLSAAGRSVAVLDADFNGPTQAQLGRVEFKPLLPDEHGLCMPKTASGIGVVSLGSIFSREQAVDFDSVAQGESHTWRATREFAALAELLSKINWGRLDFLLIDLPPGAERTVQFADFLGARTSFILITIPSRVAQGVVNRSLDALQKTQASVLGYIENMSGYYCADCDEIRPLFAASGSAALNVPCLGHVPFDPQLAELCDRGGSIVELGDVASVRALKQATGRLVEMVEQEAERGD